MINVLTSTPERVNGVSSQHKTKLKSFKISCNEWEVILILVDLLCPFYDVTRMLSAKNYITSGLSFIIKGALDHYTLLKYGRICYLDLIII